MFLHLFHSPRLQVGGVEHALAPQLPSWLLAWLAVRGRTVPREQACGVFWPERSDSEAQQNLRVNLYRLREQLRAFGAEAALQVERTQLQLDLPSDVADFRAAVVRGDGEAALAACPGRLLGDWAPRGLSAFQDWLELERAETERLCRRFVIAALQGTPPFSATALETARRLAGDDPLDEELHVAWLSALVQSGQVRAAVDAGRALTERMRAELGVAPGAQLQRLVDEAGSRLRRAAAERAERGEARRRLEEAEAMVAAGQVEAADGALGASLAELREPALRLRALVAYGRSRANGGRIEEAAAIAAEARALAQQHRQALEHEAVWTALALALALLEHLVLIRQGRVDIAFEALRCHLEAVRDAPDSPDLAALWLSLSTMHIDGDRDEEGAAAATRAIEIARRCQAHGAFVYAASNLLAAQQRLGRPEPALPLAEAALALHRVDGSDLLRANLARCHLMRGEPWRALPHAQRLVADAAGTFVEPLAHAALGDALIGMGRVDEGRAALRQALRALDANSTATVRARVLLSALHSRDESLWSQVRSLLPALAGAQLQAAVREQLRRGCESAGLSFAG